MNNHRKLFVALVASVLAALTLMGYLTWSGYQTAIHAAETATRDYAATIEARLDATLRRADADLQELARTIPVAALSDQAVPRYARELRVRLESRLVNFPELAALRIFDANGDRLYTTAGDDTPRTHIADRSYFHLLRDDPGAGLVFSEVIISRSRNQPSMVVARALRDGQGAFRGVVFAAIELDYFRKLFQSLDIGAHGTISWRRADDQRLVMRWPHLAGAVNQPLDPQNPTVLRLAAGDRTTTQHISAQTDGIARIFSTHALEHYPFYVNVAFARNDVLAAWRARTLAVGLSSLLLVGLLTGLLYRLWRTEAALKVNEELMRATFEQAAVGIAHIAVDSFHILLANRKFCDLLGYTQDELIGTDSRTRSLPHDMPAREAERARILAGTTKTSSCERQLLRKDGSLLWVNRSLSLVRDPAGKPRYFISVIEDITERKRAEETRAQLAAIVEYATDAIIGRALDGTITSWNAAAERIFGYSASEAIGQSSSMLTPEPLRRLAEDNENLRRGIVIPARESQCVTKDGRIISVISSISPVRNEAGEVVSAAVIAHDISELKQAQRELEQLNRELEQRVTARTADLAAANSELEAFSYSVAHDLRAPLRAINGYSALVLEAGEGKLDQALVDDIKRVRAASKRMGEVVDDLLDLTRLSRQEMQWREFDLSKLAASVAAALTDAHPERDVLVTIQPGMNANGDSRLMRAALENLIGNAWKFTGKTGTASIEIGAEQRDGQTVYYVRDNGAGFDMKYVHKLFAPFQRLHRSDEFEGTGIGLATVKKIIQRHGGEIWIESAVNIGTTVFFLIRKPA